MQDYGKLLIGLGVILVALGLGVHFGIGLSWLGRLPGDIRIERPNLRFYLPITTCIVISIVVTVIIRIISRFR